MLQRAQASAVPLAGSAPAFVAFNYKYEAAARRGPGAAHIATAGVRSGPDGKWTTRWGVDVRCIIIMHHRYTRRRADPCSLFDGRLAGLQHEGILGRQLPDTSWTEHKLDSGTGLRKRMWRNILSRT